ncbi:MAG: lipocalin family protein [Flavobacteriaceae bacterium]|jgi:hypothetical protein|nr:lipocalin family protein [Flavobacteriaceae bacterium]
MKKGVILAFAAITLALGTVSCSKSDDSPSQEQLLQNKWQEVKYVYYKQDSSIIGEEVEEYDDCSKKDFTEFKSDNTILEKSFYFNDKNVCTEDSSSSKGKWKFEGGKLVIYGYEPNEFNYNTIITINNNELVIESLGGNYYDEKNDVDIPAYKTRVYLKKM